MTGPGGLSPQVGGQRGSGRRGLFGAREAAMKGLEDLGLSLEGQGCRGGQCGWSILV